jgi:hypothetical protein
MSNVVRRYPPVLKRIHDTYFSGLFPFRLSTNPARYFAASRDSFLVEVTVGIFVPRPDFTR